MRYFILFILMGVLITLLNSCKKDKNDNSIITVTDIDGNVYHAVTIGSQVWITENLKTTRYCNGDLIPIVTVDSLWKKLTTGAYCNYNNDVSNGNIYGHLYNWFSVTDNRMLCPAGWHVPSDAEWTVLTVYLGNDSLVGGKMKETGTVHWIDPNTGATNSSGFTALPGGAREVNGSFLGVGVDGLWWSSTASTSTDAWSRLILGYRTSVYKDDSGKTIGFSVRCLRD